MSVLISPAMYFSLNRQLNLLLEAANNILNFMQLTVTSLYILISFMHENICSHLNVVLKRKI